MKAKFALFLGLFANAGGQSFLLVVLPPLGRRLGFSDIHTGMILSISGLLLIVSAPLWGYMSERIGRRPVLLSALAGAVLAPLAFSSIVGSRMEGVTSATLALGFFFAVRCAQTMISGGLLPAAQAYMADITTRDERTRGMGILGAAYGLGAVAGTGLAWRMGGSNPVISFVLLSILAGAALVIALLLAPEPKARDERATPADSRLELTGIWPFLGITFVAISAYAMLQQVTALRLQDALGFSVEESIQSAGAALMGTALAMIGVQGGVLRILRWRPEKLLAIGALLGAAAVLLCMLARDYVELFLALTLLGIGLGMMLPGNMGSLSLRVAAGAQGKAAGINVVAQGLGLAFGPLAGAILHQISIQAPFIVATLLLFIASALALKVWSPAGGAGRDAAR